jgi:hypothetical protein
VQNEDFEVKLVRLSEVTGGNVSKKYKGKLCVYCATRESEGADHVIAREFFSADNREGLPKAPACGLCNSLKSGLEHTFTTVLPFGSNHKMAKAMLPKARRRLGKNLSLRRTLQAGSQPVLVNQNGAIKPTISFPCIFPLASPY